MPKRMLINATQPEELRVALVDGQWLFDLDIETPGREQKKGNIYKARVIRYEPSLEAIFVYYGSERHGFLPLREISHEFLAGTGFSELNRSNVKEVLPEGREILVQIDKEERGSKGAALTTFISLAGCYLVLMPNNPRAGGISRRVEGDDRAELREILSALTIPEDMGTIIRTAGVGRQQEELQWDLDVLLSQWKAIQEASLNRPAPALIHQEGNVVIRAVRDYLRPDIDEVLIDHAEVYQDIHNYIEMVRPDFLPRIKLYKDSIPLFNRYQIESQIESAFRRSVQLPSGGALVIDHTEALVSIDINSAKATKGGDIEETAFHTNLEAADEIARQLRLRDLGGLIVIDFIDMVSVRNQRMVENRLKQAVEMDRARIQIGRISRFGLLEMSRQRLRPVLGEATRITCPRCEGQGSIRGVDSQALTVLRIIEDEAIKDNTAEIQAELPLDIATYLMNEKRHALVHVEKRHQVKVVIIPNPNWTSPHYQVHRLKMDDIAGRMVDPSSYSLTTKSEYKPEPYQVQQRPQKASEQPAITGHIPMTRAPVKKAESQSLIKRLFGTFFGNIEDEDAVKSKTASTSTTRTSATSTSGSTASRVGTEEKRQPADQQRERDRKPWSGKRLPQNRKRKMPGQGQGHGQGQGSQQQQQQQPQQHQQFHQPSGAMPSSSLSSSRQGQARSGQGQGQGQGSGSTDHSHHHPRPRTEQKPQDRQQERQQDHRQPERQGQNQDRQTQPRQEQKHSHSPSRQERSPSRQGSYSHQPRQEQESSRQESQPPSSTTSTSMMPTKMPTQSEIKEDWVQRLEKPEQKAQDFVPVEIPSPSHAGTPSNKQDLAEANFSLEVELERPSSTGVTESEANLGETNKAAGNRPQTSHRRHYHGHRRRHPHHRQRQPQQHSGDGNQNANRHHPASHDQGDIVVVQESHPNRES